jgi:outer membrane protein
MFKRRKQMKNSTKKICSISTLCIATFLLCSAAEPNRTAGNPSSGNPSQNASSAKPLKIGFVSLKRCIEQSKIGKYEQSNFESLKKQMESVLAEKEKVLNDMAAKFNDEDYLDSLSPEAETELKRKFRTLNQEISQQQNQYMQTLQQTNLKVMQKLQDQLAEAATQVAKSEKLDAVYNDEGCFYSSPQLDVSSKLIALLDQEFDMNPPNSSTDKLPTPAK